MGRGREREKGVTLGGFGLGVVGQEDGAGQPLLAVSVITNHSLISMNQN